MTPPTPPPDLALLEIDLKLAFLRSSLAEDAEAAIGSIVDAARSLISADPDLAAGLLGAIAVIDRRFDRVAAEAIDKI